MGYPHFDLFDHFTDLGFRRQVGCTIAASTGLLTAGTILAWTSTALPSLKSATLPDLTSTQEAVITALVPLTALITGPFFGYGVDRYGRRPVMLTAATLALLGWSLILLVSGGGGAIEIYMGRALTGAAAGGLLLVIPVYVTEISVPENRGSLGVGAQAATVIGILLSFLVGHFVSWRTLAGTLGILPPLGFLCLTLVLLPESPRYLLKLETPQADRDAEAVLYWLRGLHSPLDIEFELNSIRDGINLTGRKRGRRMVAPLVTCMTLMINQQLTGYAGLLFNMDNVFKGAGATPSEASTYTVITDAMMVVFLGLGVLLADKIGRRQLLMGSAALVAASQSVFGVYMLPAVRHAVTVAGLEGAVGWIPVLCMLAFFGAFAVGQGPLPWVIMTELLPAHLIGTTASVVTATHILFAFLVGHLFDALGGGSDGGGGAGAGAIYVGSFVCAASSVAAAGVVHAFVPETRQVALEDIQRERAPIIKALTPAAGESDSLLNLAAPKRSRQEETAAGDEDDDVEVDDDECGDGDGGGDASNAPATATTMAEATAGDIGPTAGAGAEMGADAGVVTEGGTGTDGGDGGGGDEDGYYTIQLPPYLPASDDPTSTQDPGN